MVVDEGQLESEEQEKLRAQAEAARLEALERERAAAEAKPEAKQRRGVLAAFQRPSVSVLAKLPFKKSKPPS